MRGHLYFHSPCFDGIVSAVLLDDYLRTKANWSEVELHGVNYDRKDDWLARPLSQPAAVVDFLYHPEARFWADHHGTTFLNEAAEADYLRRQSETCVYDPNARSCAALLWRHLLTSLKHRNSQFEELVFWADKTDSADYESVQEAIFGDTAALRINKALAGGDSDEFCPQLVRELGVRSLDEVAELPAVRDRFQHTQAESDAGLKRFDSHIAVDQDGIAVFDVDGRDVNINRYAPFYFCPQARYSLGIVRWEDGAKITAMRNPWMDFSSAPLGDIFAHEGGGGHQRVGSVILQSDRVQQATAIRQRLLARIKQADSATCGEHV